MEPPSARPSPLFNALDVDGGLLLAAEEIYPITERL
jgi:hypothetical protein